MTDSSLERELHHPIARLTLAWYDLHKRALPWRDNPTPYWVMLSEYMLQQTQVETVKPYFARFTERYTSIKALAEAEDDDVMALWAGLGYYSRARNLLKAARQINADGQFPQSVKGLRALPGVGPYIAGAIGSIALGLDVPAVDGNHHRVFARLFRDKGDRNAMWSIAERVLPAGRAGDFNQALMDLGSQICTSKNPKCTTCPLQSECQAHAEGDVADFPVKAKRKAKANRTLSAYLLRQNGAMLLCKRPQKGLFGGLYEPPIFFIETQSVQASTELWLENSGQAIDHISTLGVVNHVLTHMNMTVTVYLIECAEAPEVVQGYVEQQWVASDKFDEIGLSTLARKILAVEQEDHQLSLMDALTESDGGESK